MIVPCNIHVVTTAANVRAMYAVYMHIDHDDKIHYIGVTPLSVLFTLEDAHSNSMWNEMFSQPLTTLQIKVCCLTDSEREAMIEQRRLIGIHRPICNIKGYNATTYRQHIKCVETGEIFETMTEAARAHNLVYSQLNSHVNRKPGHKSVKGRTYIRTMESNAK